MVVHKRLENVQSCLESVIADEIEGDVIETGVWRGGTCILMKALLNLRGSQKRLFVADSFRGVPKPDPGKYPADAAEERKEAFYLFDQVAVSLKQVQDNFRRFGVLDDRVHFLEGWFKYTLSTDVITKLALMRLDGDLYESTWDALINLYPKLQAGGYCIIDDYGGIPVCKQAVDDYRRQQGIYDAIIPIDTTGVYWRRQSKV
jgi:O-methyltransferase